LQFTTRIARFAGQRGGIVGHDDGKCRA
jgi:hypothetical protein